MIDAMPARVGAFFDVDKTILSQNSGTLYLRALYERGEVDGRCGWSWSSINATGADWLRDKKISLTIQFAMKKHPDLPHIPLIRDLVTDPADKQALDVHLSPQVYGRPFATGPKVPADRAEAQEAESETAEAAATGGERLGVQSVPSSRARPIAPAGQSLAALAPKGPVAPAARPAGSSRSHRYTARMWCAA